MLDWQFLAQNLHFSISLFAALVCFAVFWLYFDAWSNNKEKKEVYKSLGFLFLSLSFLIFGALTEQTTTSRTRIDNFLEPLFLILHSAGYVFIIIGELVDPIQEKPDIFGRKKNPPIGPQPAPSATPAIGGGFSIGSLGAASAAKLLVPFAGFIIAGLYLRRATKGLERHLRPVGFAFLCLAIFDLLSLSSQLRETLNPIVYSWVAPYGPIWLAGHLFLLLGSIILGRWVWKYLTKRIQSQLFMIFSISTVTIFLIATISFTFLLMSSLRGAALSNLETAANTLNYALGSKKAESSASAEIIAQNPSIANAVNSQDHEALVKLTQSFLAKKRQSSLIIVDSSGQVLLRGEDPSQYGDSLSSDLLIRRALIGDSTSTIVSTEGVLYPLVYVRTATPIRDSGGTVIGATVAGLTLDNAFVDGIKRQTGLDTTIYAENTRSATTLEAEDGKSRLLGIKEANVSVVEQVLRKGQNFKGTVNISNKPYLAVYAPVKDSENVPVGMLFIGSPRIDLLKTAGQSVQLTFLMSVVLLLLASWPAYVAARYINRQLS